MAKKTTDSKELKKIEDLLIEVKSFTYIRLMAAKIKNSNIEKLEKAILESENVEEIKKFAKSVKKSKMSNFTLLL